MANGGKRGFFSSLFRSRKQKEREETADLESRQRLEERIQQILAEKVEVPELFAVEKKSTGLMTQEEAEVEVELLPISASVIPIRKAPVQPAFVLSTYEVPRSYAANER